MANEKNPPKLGAFPAGSIRDTLMRAHLEKAGINANEWLAANDYSFEYDDGPGGVAVLVTDVRAKGAK